MTQLLSIEHDRIVIKHLALDTVSGPVNFNDSINVAGAITADTITVKRIITEEKSGANDPFAFIGNGEKEIVGKGLYFSDGLATRQLVYKEGGRLWSTMDIDLAKEQSFSIDRIPVLTATALGSSVVKSSLRTVGELDSLTVSGDSTIGSFAFFNSAHGRFGINIEEPNGTFSIAENNVEITVGSNRNDYGYIGTFNNTGLELGTDNTPRITISNAGSITIGHPNYKNAIVRIYGKLEVDEIVNDPRNGKFEPLTFTAADGKDVFGTGIVWSRGVTESKFVYMSGDRIWSSDVIDLAEGKHYAIGDTVVLSKTSLGPTVTDSELTSVGTLRNLTVSGNAAFSDASAFKVTANTLGVATIAIDDTLVIAQGSEQEFKIDTKGSIELGNKQNSNRTVSVYGKLSVGASNPDPTMSLTVNGPVSLDNKRFISGTAIPTAGHYSKGDICWNTEPTPTSYIGWVCTKDGTPGEWSPFGLIA